VHLQRGLFTNSVFCLVFVADGVGGPSSSLTNGSGGVVHVGKKAPLHVAEETGCSQGLPRALCLCDSACWLLR
jgi:hypothetical protein